MVRESLESDESDWNRYRYLNMKKEIRYLERKSSVKAHLDAKKIQGYLKICQGINETGRGNSGI